MSSPHKTRIPEPPQVPELWLTVPQFAAAYGHHHNTVMRFVREGRLQSKKVVSRGGGGTGRVTMVLVPHVRSPQFGQCVSDVLPILTCKQVGKVLGITRSGVEWLSSNKHGQKIRYTIMGGKRIFSIMDVRRFLMEREARRRKLPPEEAMVEWAKEKIAAGGADKNYADVQKYFT